MSKIAVTPLEKVEGCLHWLETELPEIMDSEEAWAFIAGIQSASVVVALREVAEYLRATE